MSTDFCKRCRRRLAVDDWDNSPDFVDVECRDYTIASLQVRLREAGDRQRDWGVERAMFERTLGGLRSQIRDLEVELSHEKAEVARLLRLARPVLRDRDGGGGQ